MKTKKGKSTEGGFTLVELAIATVVLLVGVVAVMQLVPAAMTSNLRNRQDTSAAVVGQRIRELIVRQPVSATNITDPTGLLPCGTAAVCLFGDPARNDQPVGARLTDVRAPNGAVVDVRVDFGAGVDNGYSFLYTDPNDPQRTSYEVRWVVVTSSRAVGLQPNVIVAKRIIVGARRLGDPSQSVYFDTLLVR